jgi:hypothetical protein
VGAPMPIMHSDPVHASGCRESHRMAFGPGAFHRIEILEHSGLGTGPLQLAHRFLWTWGPPPRRPGRSTRLGRNVLRLDLPARLDEELGHRGLVGRLGRTRGRPKFRRGVAGCIQRVKRVSLKVPSCNTFPLWMPKTLMSDVVLGGSSAPFRSSLQVSLSMHGR